MILKFSADYCVPCQHLSKTLDTLGIFYKDIDIEKEPELTAKYRVRSVPTLICEVDGTVYGTLVGNKSEKELKEWVEDCKAALAA